MYTRQRKMECDGSKAISTVFIFSQYLQTRHALIIFREELICEANSSRSSGLISRMFLLKTKHITCKGSLE